jgi:aminoglycoside phosphotransferase
MSSTKTLHSGVESAIDRIKKSRRLDWQFLLPSLDAASVYYHGPENDDLIGALRHAFAAVHVNEQLVPAHKVDLVILRNPSLRDLSMAMNSLRPGGYLYLEVERRLRPSALLATNGFMNPVRSFRTLFRILQNYGFDSLAAYWHRSGFASSKEIIPLHENTGLRFLFANTAHGLRKKIALWLGRLSFQTGLLKHLIKSFSVVARKSDTSKTNSGNYITHYLELNKQRLKLSKYGKLTDLVTIFLTPQFEASGHVVALILDPADAKPVLVAKIHRLPGRSERLAHEQANLSALQNAWHEIVPQIPRLVNYEIWQNHEILLETAVPGKILKPAWVRRNSALAQQTAAAWLSGLHRATICQVRNERWFAEQVEEPLQSLANSLPELFSDSDLISNTMQKLNPLCDLSIPRVFEHGDFSAPNLLIEGNGMLGVVDWENAAPQGLPLIDYFIYLSFHSLCLSRNTGGKSDMKPFQAAFFGKNCWAGKQISRYAQAHGIPALAIKPLFLSTWPRYVAQWSQRLLEQDTNSASRSRIDLQIRGNRYFDLWRYTLANWDHLFESEA